MDYITLLETSFEFDSAPSECTPHRQKYICESIFNIYTYDTAMSRIMVDMILEVAEQITNNSTYNYLESSAEKYKQYLTVCHLPFIADHIEWGTSIRTVWWSHGAHYLDSCGIYWENGNQLMNYKIPDQKAFIEFMKAVAEFVVKENK